MLFTNLTFGKNACLALYNEAIELFSLCIDTTPLPASHGNFWYRVLSTERVSGLQLKNENSKMKN